MTPEAATRRNATGRALCEKRNAAGLCVQCEQPQAPGSRRCAKCGERRKAISRKHHRVRSPISKMAAVLRNARARAGSEGREFSITIEDLLPLPFHCSILGIELLYSFAGKKGPRAASPSIDRIDNALGYVKGNVRVISFRANRIRNDASLDELRAITRDAEILMARKLTQH